MEHEGNATIRLGQFKLVRLHDCPWELYDIEAELTDLARCSPKLEKEMIRQYQAWADRVGIMD